MGSDLGEFPNYCITMDRTGAGRGVTLGELPVPLPPATLELGAPGPDACDHYRLVAMPHASCGNVAIMMMLSLLVTTLLQYH